MEATTAKPFTPDGTGTVVDNATDEDGKEFFTITTPSENVFYLVIDRQRTEDNVYFLNAVTEKDLLALAVADPEPEVMEPVTPPAPEPEPVTEPEPEKDAGFPVGNLLMIAAVLLVGGGAAYYFKVYRPKHEAPIWTRVIMTTTRATPTAIWKKSRKRRTRHEFYQQSL